MNMQMIPLEEMSRMREGDDPFRFWTAHVSRLTQMVEDLRVAHDKTAVDVRRMTLNHSIESNIVDRGTFAVTRGFVEVDFDRVYVAGVNEIEGGA